MGIIKAQRGEAQRAQKEALDNIKEVNDFDSKNIQRSDK